MKLFNRDGIPTKRELIKRYGFDIFPNNITDYCCGHTHYLMDFITHRVQYHGVSIRETMQELDEFINEIWRDELKK